MGAGKVNPSRFDGSTRPNLNRSCKTSRFGSRRGRGIGYYPREGTRDRFVACRWRAGTGTGAGEGGERDRFLPCSSRSLLRGASVDTPPAPPDSTAAVGHAFTMVDLVRDIEGSDRFAAAAAAEVNLLIVLAWLGWLPSLLPWLG